MHNNIPVEEKKTKILNVPVPGRFEYHDPFPVLCPFHQPPSIHSCCTTPTACMPRLCPLTVRNVYKISFVRGIFGTVYSLPLARRITTLNLTFQCAGCVGRSITDMWYRGKTGFQLTTQYTAMYCQSCYHITFSTISTRTQFCRLNCEHTQGADNVAQVHCGNNLLVRSNAGVQSYAPFHSPA